MDCASSEKTMRFIEPVINDSAVQTYEDCLYIYTHAPLNSLSECGSARVAVMIANISILRDR